MNLKKAIKTLDMADISLIKLSVLFFTLALITTFDVLMELVHSVNTLWFWGLGILFMIRPTIKCFKK